MAPNKRTPFQIEEDRRRITEFYLRGKRQHEIADELNLSRSQIAYDLKVIQKRWREDTTFDLDEAKARELARLDEIEREAWSAWERSYGQHRTTTATRRTGGRTGGGNVGVVKTEDMAGNPAYLRVALDCVDRRCKLLGLDAPAKLQHSGDVGIGGGLAALEARIRAMDERAVADEA